MGQLFVVATPIGNLEDVSLRALRVLSEVALVAAEDTRTAGILLSHHGIKSRLVSYTDHNKTQRIPEILGALENGDVALVTDAGTPAISDPGVDLAGAARLAGHSVVSVPGPSAVVAALSVAGLPSASFRFAGFLPRSEGDLRRLLEAHSRGIDALVAFESPQRLRKSLAVIEAVSPGLRVAVCRELTKHYEEVFVGTAAECRAHFTEPRGEIVLVIEPPAERVKGIDDDSDLRREIATMQGLGLTRSQATTLLGERYDLPRRRLYELWLEVQGEEG